ncbi:MAG: hypothetical protein V2A69_12725 [Pseudomonadota bacterium]
MIKGKALVIILLFVFFLHVFPFTGWTAVNVAIFPFEIHSDEDITYLRDGIWRMLASRIGLSEKVYVIEKSQINEVLKGKDDHLTPELIQSIGYQLDLDYIIIGNLTKKENSITIEGNVINSTDNTLPQKTFSVTCDEVDEVMYKVTTLAEEIREKMINPAQPTEATLSDFSETKEQPLKEERILSGEPAGIGPSDKVVLDSEPTVSQAISSETPSPEKNAETGKPSLNYWRSGKIAHTIKGMAVGDADGDDRNEIVCITDTKVLLYRKTKKKLKKIAEYEEKDPIDFLKVDIADVNGNGAEEIFITSTKEGVPASMVVEYKNKKLTKIAENLSWFFGVVHFPEEGPVLLGQTYGNDNPLQGEVHRITWESGGYVASPLEGLPGGLNVFGLGVLGEGGSSVKEFVGLDNTGRLSVYAEKGTLQWESKKPFGGSVISFKVSANRSQNAEDQRVFLPMRLIIKDLNNDKEKDIIIGHNFSEDEEPKRASDEGFIYDLQWNGAEMTTRWKTEKLDECIIDYTIADADNDGKEELVLAVSSGRSYLTFRAKSYILMYEIV